MFFNKPKGGELNNGSEKESSEKESSEEKSSEEEKVSLIEIMRPLPTNASRLSGWPVKPVLAAAKISAVC